MGRLCNLKISKTLSLLMIFILTTTMFVFQSMSVNASDK